MIVVRDIFDVDRDKLREAEPLFRELQAAGTQVGLGPVRVMVDRTDAYFGRPQERGRIVVECEFSTTESFSEKSYAAMDDDRLRAAWKAVKPVVHQARREILDAIG